MDRMGEIASTDRHQAKEDSLHNRHATSNHHHILDEIRTVGTAISIISSLWLGNGIDNGEIPVISGFLYTGGLTAAVIAKRRLQGLDMWNENEADALPANTIVYNSSFPDRADELSLA